MLGKVILGSFFLLVVIGLGLSGILNAALDGYHKIQSNPVIETLQTKASGTIKNQLSSDLNAITHVVATKIGGSA